MGVIVPQIGVGFGTVEALEDRGYT
jgi:hypothetical protein